MINKKIKKLKRKGFSKEKELKTIHRIKQVAHNKIVRDVLSKGNLLEERRTRRKKAVIRNIKKAKSFKPNMKSGG